MGLHSQRLSLTVLVTGSAGFLGRNLVTALRRIDGVQVVTHGSSESRQSLDEKIAITDVIYHLAGANRPKDEATFQRVNTELTRHVAAVLQRHSKPTTVVFSSSIQAENDNAYGVSKRAAEDTLIELGNQSNHRIAIYRLPNVFGKWSRPNYNSVVATFCHNIARDDPISISNPDHELYLVYIDDVIRCFLGHLDHALFENAAGVGDTQRFVEIQHTHRISLGDLAKTIRMFRSSRKDLRIPNVAVPLTKNLYSTYLSFLPRNEFSYDVDLKTDDRGWLFELAKSKSFGQVFVSTTKPGGIRGDHYHDSKVEKFCLVRGRGVVRFRGIESTEVIEYEVDDQAMKIVDIPPGFAHSIENIGNDDMIVLFWSCEEYSPDRTDTYRVPVIE